MTRGKLIRCLKLTLNRHQGQTTDALASALADAIEDQLAIEAAEEEPSEVIDFPSKPASEKPRTAGPPPAPAAAVVLASEESVPVEPIRPQPVQPIRLQPQTDAGAELEVEYWTYAGLISELESKTPARMEIIPERSTHAIVLDRNIQAGIGMKIVKLTYRLASLKGSEPSEPSMEGLYGKLASPMALDLFVEDNFSLLDQNQHVPERLERLKATAAKVYAPRPKEIRSSTPVRVGGDLRWDESTPHVSI